MTAEPSVDIERIRAARARIADTTRVTPTWPAAGLPTDDPVLLKCEHLQTTGSFKVRGALNFVRSLSAPPEGGLAVVSAGNHAQGVAFAARALAVPVTVVMPVTAPLAKVRAARELGARVVLHGASLDAARERAQEIARAENRLLVPPYDDDDVIAGQGTVGLEILEQAPDVAEILVPVGGGGLLAGIATAVKAVRPAVRVIGVQARAMEGVRRSFEAGRVVHVPPERTLADGVAVSGPSERTFALIRRYVDEVVSVGEEAIAQAIVTLLERSKVVAEGAGALAVAAIESGAHRPVGQAVAVISGGNIDINLVGTIVRHGLVEAGRYRRLSFEVGDSPGELALVAGAIAAAGGNILDVEHHREAPHLPVGVAVLDLIVEVNGPEHFADVVRSLRRSGLRGRSGRGSRLVTPVARRRHLQG